MAYRILSEHELSRLLSKKRWLNENSREFWFMSATLGLSEEEVEGLSWNDIDIKEGFVSVPDKDKGIRLIPISPSAKVFLVDLALGRSGGPEEPVFPLQPSAYEDLNQAARDCGIIKQSETLAPEVLKVSFLKYLLKSGKRREEIEEIYGDIPS